MYVMNETRELTRRQTLEQCAIPMQPNDEDSNECGEKILDV